MPNISDPKVRKIIEEQFAGDIAKFLAYQKKRLARIIVEGGIIDWQEEARLLDKALGYTSFNNVMESALAMLASMPAGVEIPVIQEAATRWLVDYKFGLIRNINDSTEKIIRSAVTDWVSTPGMTRGDLEQLISRGFGPERASAIAVTETTRAIAQGELIVSDELGKMGIRMLDIWNTDNDDLVCPLCAPLNRKEVKHGVLFYEPDGYNDGYPPRHVNCRCSMTHRIDRGE